MKIVQLIRYNTEREEQEIHFADDLLTANKLILSLEKNSNDTIKSTDIQSEDYMVIHLSSGDFWECHRVIVHTKDTV